MRPGTCTPRCFGVTLLPCRASGQPAAECHTELLTLASGPAHPGIWAGTSPPGPICFSHKTGCSFLVLSREFAGGMSFQNCRSARVALRLRVWAGEPDSGEMGCLLQKLSEAATSHWEADSDGRTDSVSVKRELAFQPFRIWGGKSHDPPCPCSSLSRSLFEIRTRRNTN